MSVKGVTSTSRRKYRSESKVKQQGYAVHCDIQVSLIIYCSCFVETETHAWK